MSTVIKAADRNAAIQATAFNFDDMASKATAYLDKVRAEAAQIVVAAKKQAQDEAAAIKAKAETEGRRTGQATIDQTVQRQLAQHLTTLMPALKQAVAEIQHAKQAWLTQWEKSAVHLAAAIASKVIRRELAAQPEIPLALVRESLELASGGGQVRLYLNPADWEGLRPQIELIVQELSRLAPAEIVPDPSITAGGCRVETRFGSIDQRFESQLARIEEELA
jgi:flagellar assembly protein FliH